jgi:peroxiredoxin family protein
MSDDDSQDVLKRLAALESQVGGVQEQLSILEQNKSAEKASILVFSGNFDKLITSFILATGAAAMGIETTMFFTFWGLTGIKKKSSYADKHITEKMIAMMLPSDNASIGNTSMMNMGGVGPLFFKYVMGRKNVETLPGLVSVAQEMGVKFIACQMSMEVMGIKEEELLDDVEYGGVMKYVQSASEAGITLFV